MKYNRFFSTLNHKQFSNIIYPSVIFDFWLDQYQNRVLTLKHVCNGMYMEGAWA